ncbi:MAG: hypothetical protein RML33_08710, partial [Acidobacteriota bacterium]|nr:hypothetical protein [Acidobacteriota bacterium]
MGTSGRFIGILVSSAGSAGTYSFQGNVITAISVSGSSSGTDISAPFAGILMISGGAANYGTTAPNVIGSSTTPASITFSTTSTSSADVYGIYHFPLSNCNMTNNVVGGINVSNTTTAALVFYGLRQFTGTSQTNIFVNNKVGTASAPIQVSSSGTGSRVVGIYSQSGITTMIGNTVNNISINSPNTGTGTSASAIGIWISSTASGHNIEANTVENVTNTNSTAAVSVSGIVYDGGGTGVVQRNLIRGLATPNTTSSAGIVAGISVTSGTTTFRNNMIALGSGMSNSPQIRGIDESAGTNNFYYNSVYISGTATSGSGNSHAFHSTVTVNARNYRNNIFYNGRSNSGGATGTHYAIRVGGTGT